MSTLARYTDILFRAYFEDCYHLYNALAKYAYCCLNGRNPKPIWLLSFRLRLIKIFYLRKKKRSILGRYIANKRRAQTILLYTHYRDIYYKRPGSCI